MTSAYWMEPNTGPMGNGLSNFILAAGFRGMGCNMHRQYPWHYPSKLTTGRLKASTYRGSHTRESRTISH